MKQKGKKPKEIRIAVLEPKAGDKLIDIYYESDFTGTYKIELNKLHIHTYCWAEKLEANKKWNNMEK